jgi:hypothetical protein
MTREEKAKQLIADMGSRWIGHPQFKLKPRSYLHVENLANVQPTIAVYDSSSVSQLRRLIMGMML